MIKLSFAPSARFARRLSLGAALSAGLVMTAMTPAEAAKTTLNLGMSVEPAGLDPTIAAPVAIGQVAVHDDVDRREIREALKVLTSREARMS